MLDESRRYHEGIALFNAGEFFAAHEVWEDVWRLASGEKKRFFQGLIQCAVTLEHVRRGNPRGVANVFHSAQGKFEGLPGRYLGLDIPAFLGAMRRFVAPVLALPAERLAPGQVRGMVLPVNLAEAPRLEVDLPPLPRATACDEPRP